MIGNNYISLYLSEIHVNKNTVILYCIIRMYNSQQVIRFKQAL